MTATVATVWRRTRATLCAVAMAAVLVACDTAEERAERHYRSGLELLQAGDVQRARVEFQTVFTYVSTHREARVALANLFLDNGDIADAFGQFSTLVEQYPDETEGRVTLVEMAYSLNRWEDAERHAEALRRQNADSPRAQVVLAAEAYRQAVLGNDDTARREAADRLRGLRETVPDSVIAGTMVIDSLILDGEDVAALAELDKVQPLAPGDRRLYQMRLGVLDRLQDFDGTEATLKEMIERFPDEPVVVQTLMAFYGNRRDFDAAEGFLRSRIVEGRPDDDARMALLQFLPQVRGIEAAYEMAERFVEEGTNDPLFRKQRAIIRFDLGETGAAIAELEALLVDAESSDLTRETKLALARGLALTGNEVGSRALVEEVLSEDQSNVEALLMKAAWLIQRDETDEAIGLLRIALDQEPSNVQVLTSMAEAEIRIGRPELGGEMLSRAVEASNRAPLQSLLYARFLSSDNRLKPAEAVLVDALRRSPENLDLLTELGRVYVRLEDWPRAEQVERRLRELDTAQSNGLADRLRVTILGAQQRESDAIAFLEGLLARDGSNRAAEVAILRSHLARGDAEAARGYLDSLIEDAPGDANLRFLSAALDTALGNLESAETQYRGLIDDGVESQRVWVELIRILNATGRTDEAQTALQAGLDQIPEAPDLLWMRATFLERQQDFEGAIAIYERLYESNSATSVTANNLASLLSTVRDDPESLDRAWRIARRLRDSDFAPYQDTYGWIAFLRGDVEDALRHIEPAAEALPGDPVVQLHYGLVLAETERKDEAIAQLEKALGMAPDDPRPAFERARETLAQLRQGDNTGDSATE